MTQRFRILPAPGDGHDFRQTLTVPPGGAACGPPAAYALGYYQHVPGSDFKGLIFAVHNLPEGAAVVWTLSGYSLGNFFIMGFGAVGTLDVALVAESGQSGSINCAVNGIDAGTLQIVAGAEGNGLFSGDPSA